LLSAAFKTSLIVDIVERIVMKSLINVNELEATPPIIARSVDEKVLLSYSYEG
jgi:hypothetical protein